MRRPPLTTAAIDDAILEYDAIGGDAFLKRYGFGPSKGYFLVKDGKEYDSKAIVGAAHGKMDGGTPMTAKELKGGYSGAAMALKNTGYDVRGPDPDWTWDEHVLALELYLQTKPSPPGKSSPQITELSVLLNRLADSRLVIHSPKFRNADGVYMKLMNFRRVDPDFQSQGKSGLTRGAKGEEDVWARYANDLSALSNAAAIIKSLIESDEVPKDTEGHDTADYYDVEGTEGSLVLRTHLVRERDRALVGRKKAEALENFGALRCECCEFDFGAVYGKHGEGYAEVHHINPIALSEPGRKTKLSELAVVCANCHRMLHRGGLISVAELRTRIDAAANAAVTDGHSAPPCPRPENLAGT